MGQSKTGEEPAHLKFCRLEFFSVLSLHYISILPTFVLKTKKTSEECKWHGN